MDEGDFEIDWGDLEVADDYELYSVRLEPIPRPEYEAANGEEGNGNAGGNEGSSASPAPANDSNNSNNAGNTNNTTMIVVIVIIVVVVVGAIVVGIVFARKKKDEIEKS